MDSEVFAHLTDRGVELAKKLAHGGKVCHCLIAAFANLRPKHPAPGLRFGSHVLQLRICATPPHSTCGAHQRAEERHWGGQRQKACPCVTSSTNTLAQGHTAKDFLRRLKAQWVKSSQAQDDGAADPGAFQWEDMGLSVSHMFRPAPGVFCMVRALHCA